MSDEVLIDFRAVARGLIYDTGIEDAECHAEMLGLPPATEEGVEMEKKLSEARLSRLKPIEPLLTEHASILSGVMLSVHYDLPHLDYEGNEEQVFELLRSAKQMTPLYASVAVSSAATFLSLLLENGIVKFAAEKIEALEFDREQ